MPSFRLIPDGEKTDTFAVLVRRLFEGAREGALMDDGFSLDRLCYLPRELHEVVLEHVQWLRLNPGGQSDPTGPIFRYHAAEQIEERRKLFEGGDQYSLMVALRICANHDLPMPQWLSRAYIAAFDAVHMFRASSWDEVLGPPIPSGSQARSLRTWFRLRLAVPDKVRELSKTMPIDDHLFSVIAREMKVGKTAIRNAYYDIAPESWKKFIAFRNFQKSRLDQ